MKNLNFNQMKSVNGGVNCFLLGLSTFFGALGSVQTPVTGASNLLTNFKDIKGCWDN